MEKERAIINIRASRERLLQALHGLSSAECCTEAIEGTWTVKEVIAHICAWDTSLSLPLRKYLESGEFTPEEIDDHDAWNAQQTAQRKENSFTEVLDEAERTRDELISLASRLAPEDWEHILRVPWGGRETLAEMIAGLAWHENEHARRIADLQQM